MIRLSLPSRISLSYVGIFAGMVFVLQQLEHTSLFFSACCFVFIMAGGIGFNIGGGLTRPTGGYIFFFAVIALIVALVAKIFLGEPADSNLLRPRVTIAAYTIGIVMMVVSAELSSRFRKRKPVLASMVTDATLRRAAIGCLAFGTFLTVATYTTTRGSGTAWSALLQINRFNELAVILDTIATIRLTGGRRSISVTGLASAAVIFFADGVLGFSKEGMFTPIVCWLVAAASEGIRLSRAQVVGGVLGFAFLSYFMVPYSQYGRTQTSGSFVGNIQVAQRLLNDLPHVREIYEENQAQDLAGGVAGYFHKPMGLFDRLEMISPDDALIDATERHGAFGYYPILEDFEALVPHVFWAGKPAILWGNVYAHEAGINIPEDDFSTGVSFSPIGEGYHLGMWVGMVVLCPAIWIFIFTLFDSLCGDVRQSPWGLLTIIYFAHAAPEGQLGGLIYASFYFTFTIVFAAITVAYVMPLLGSLFTGPTRVAIPGATPQFRSPTPRPRP